MHKEVNSNLHDRHSLGDYAVGRDNNFNLLRFLAASAVVVNHSDAVVRGTETTSASAMGMDLGNIAVDIFFVTSGFLVTGSLLKRPLGEYFNARIRRILPALFVSILFCVFIIGLTYTTNSTGNFLSHKETCKFIIKNGTLLSGAAFSLPGVFSHSPISNVVNGSLWTLPWEARLYVVSGVIAAVVRSLTKNSLVWLARILTLMAVTLFIVHTCNHFFKFVPRDAARVVAMFYVGAAYYCWRKYVPLNRRYLLTATAVLAGSLWLHPDAFFIGYVILIPYIVMGAVYLPHGSIRNFNLLGDYSYGIYIFSFPIQQAIVASFHDVSPLWVFLLSFPISLAIAIASWHLIESPLLKKRQAKVVQPAQ